MKVLFCHDGPIYCDIQNRFYSVCFNDELLSRYEEVFGNVSIVTRVNKEIDRNGYTDAGKLTSDRFRVIEYPNYLTIKGVFSRKKDSTKLLEEEIKRCDALIVRLPSFIGSKCIKYARKHKKPFLVELVGCPWDSLRNHSLLGKFLAPYMYAITRYQVNRATDVLYVTNEFLQSRYPTTGRKIGCSDVELSEDKAKVIRVKEKKSHNNIVVGTIGKIDLKYKGHKTVINAMKILKERGCDVQYHVVGPGNRAYIEHLAKKNGVLDNIVFVGTLDHDKIFAWLDSLDIYIQPSLTEGMPRSLIEAMSRGLSLIHI